MNLNAIKSIYKFNQEAGLLESGYDDFRESEYPIEEALEQFDTSYLATALAMHPDASPKSISRSLVTGMCKLPESGISDVDRLDKHLDNLVFNLGSIFKLGLNVQQTMKALQVVATANMQKLGAGKDEHGKQLKGENFINPEPLLQLILNERA